MNDMIRHRHQDAHEIQDYRVSVKVRNNRILEMIERAGYVSVLQFAKAHRFSAPTLYTLINLKRIRILKDRTGEFTSFVNRLAAVLGCGPMDLFSEEQLAMELEHNERHLKVSSAEMRFMLAHATSGDPLALLEDEERTKAIASALECLSKRQRRIIEMRFFTDPPLTLKECGKEFDLTPARVRQIELRAIEKMRSSNVDAIRLLRQDRSVRTP